MKPVAVVPDEPEPEPEEVEDLIDTSEPAPPLQVLITIVVQTCYCSLKIFERSVRMCLRS